MKLKRISSIPILDTLEDFHIKIRYLIDLVTLLGGFEREKASEFWATISKSPPARSPVKFKNRTTGGGYEPKKTHLKVRCVYGQQLVIGEAFDRICRQSCSINVPAQRASLARPTDSDIGSDWLVRKVKNKNKTTNRE